jgi:arylsulfatase B
MSGRLPVHLGVILGSPLTWDGGADPTQGYDGLSPNMTVIPRVLRELGYRTHLSGKADGFGMATREHVPAGRGFESALGYFAHANDYYNYTVGPKEIAAQYPCLGQIVTPFNGTDVIDQWEDFHNANRPPAKFAQCDKSKAQNCPYEDDVLVNRAVDVINGFDQTDPHAPLFLVATLHNPHTPLQAPPVDYISQFCNSSAAGPFRGQCDLQERNVRAIVSFFLLLTVKQLLLQMMAYIDRQIARIETAIKAKPGMWENTLLLFISDNGGGSGIGVGGNVFPFRGGKGSDWEGGFRVPAFLAGGFLPAELAGTTYDEIIAVKVRQSDFFAISFSDNCI